MWLLVGFVMNSVAVDLKFHTRKSLRQTSEDLSTLIARASVTKRNLDELLRGAATGAVDTHVRNRPSSTDELRDEDVVADGIDSSNHVLPAPLPVWQPDVDTAMVPAAAPMPETSPM